MEIEYRTIDRFPGYRFGSDGTIWSCWQRGKFAQMYISSTWRKRKATLTRFSPYLTISLRRSDGTHATPYVHRVILEAFSGPCPEGMESRHLDGNPEHNAILNLKWGTHDENHEDKLKHGRHQIGSRHHNAVLSDSDIPIIRKMAKRGVRPKAIAISIGKSIIAIRGVLEKKSWTHIKEDSIASNEKTSVLPSGS